MTCMCRSWTATYQVYNVLTMDQLLGEANSIAEFFVKLAQYCDDVNFNHVRVNSPQLAAL